MSLVQSRPPSEDMGKHPDSGDIREQFCNSRDDGESGSEPDIADIERIYRYAFSVSSGKKKEKSKEDVSNRILGSWIFASSLLFGFFISFAQPSGPMFHSPKR